MRVEDLPRALVVSTGRNSAWVAVDGEVHPRVARLRRMTGKRFMPVPGDVVRARILEDGSAVVERIEPRSLILQRQTAGGRAKTMAANVDMLVTVTALAHPTPRLVTLDQLLAFAEISGVAGVVVFTKADLAASPQREDLPQIYRRLHYPTLVTNPKTGQNIEALRTAIGDRHAMLAGNSGVGKSTIFRSLGGEGSVGDVSRYGLGRQTTTAARLYRLGDGFLIDSPGVNEFGLGALGAAELAAGFREMREPAGSCRFADCRHLQEPDCAVRAEVEAGRMAESRYASYAQLLTHPR
ncbi:MAG TPA: ribosome small subunit-dependent GTPase A [Candidatus Tumulicola sp.]|nr:ribosome small subunit-dependent GTPase A [Candidatus Tumulicola sp.]